jgi:lipoprotein NlpD
VVTDRSPGKSGQTTYTVARGDTLYSIAWRFNLDYRRFAATNQIGPPFTIYPGQKLRLTDQPLSGAKKKRPIVTVAQASSKPKAAPKQPPAKTPRAKAAVTRRPEPARAAAKAPQKTAASGSKTWHRPLPQKPSVVFGKKSKGLDYAISSRARVRNTRSGEVVYAGNGIAGFERLVIVKHSSELLSAYSFNGKMLVAEQQQVGGGEVIADILPRPGVGQTLHFELRRKGLPINPQTLIR